MPLSNRTLVLLAMFLLAIRLLSAQTNPSGHWEGTISAPFGEAAIEVDLAQNADGKLIGTFNSVAEHLKGLPLSNLSVHGDEVAFELKAASGDGHFEGKLLDGGKSMSGRFGSFSVSFTKTGEARFELPPKGAPVSKELEGTWAGMLDLGSASIHITLKISNHPNGTSTATLASIEEGIEAPAAIVQKDTSLNLTVGSLNSSWSGAINPSAAELSGTYKNQLGEELPLTFRRTGGN